MAFEIRDRAEPQFEVEEIRQRWTHGKFVAVTREHVVAILKFKSAEKVKLWLRYCTPLGNDSK